MERKEYFRYTKPLEPYEAECTSKMDVIEMSGRATWIKDRGKYGLEMKIAGQWCYFKKDEVIKLVQKYLESRDEVLVKSFCNVDYKNEVISFENKTKGISVVNKHWKTILDYQEKVAGVHEETYDMLYPILKDTASVAMILKKVQKGYELVNIMAFDSYWVHGQDINPFLVANNFQELFKNEHRVLGYVDARFDKIPGTDCVLYVCGQKVKRYDCRCGASFMKNRSLLVPQGYGNYDYLCAHCFFKKMNISVSDEFKKNFSSEEHIFDTSIRYRPSGCASVEDILCGK